MLADTTAKLALNFTLFYGYLHKHKFANWLFRSACWRRTLKNSTRKHSCPIYMIESTLLPRNANFFQSEQ